MNYHKFQTNETQIDSLPNPITPFSIFTWKLMFDALPRASCSVPSDRRRKGENFTPAVESGN